MPNTAVGNVTSLLHPVDSAAQSPYRYSADFRRDALRRVTGGQPISQVSKDLGVARNTLKSWMREEHDDAVAPLTTVMATDLRGDRIQVLRGLRDTVAALIANGVSGRDMPANARLLMDITKELEALENVEKAEEEQAVAQDEPFNPEDI